MAAVIGLDRSRSYPFVNPFRWCSPGGQFQRPGSIVISGEKGAVDKALPCAKMLGPRGLFPSRSARPSIPAHEARGGPAESPFPCDGKGQNGHW